jgi:hypothetical protein
VDRPRRDMRGEGGRGVEVPGIDEDKSYIYDRPRIQRRTREERREQIQGRRAGRSGAGGVSAARHVDGGQRDDVM